ncbi:MAG: family 20 glycosylhydrolase [Actinomycetaceae bacterium]|nr:family 20 glycosylhydrolase [Actinomycetaceae bacterium]MDU0969842.1 family 20 glycosylhydrolase [Actinomycetaceae bacterium]
MSTSIVSPLDAARALGVRIVPDPAVTRGYVVERDPADPTTPGSAEVGGFALAVRADTPAGVAAGCAQVAAELHANLPVTVGRHTPPLGHRALHVDAGRKYFTPDQLEDLLRMMAWARLNVLNLHISETLGYRLESRRHPEVVAPDHLTIADVRRLRETAADLGIRIVPGFDMPGHLGGVLEANPWAALADGSRTYPGALDILNPRATALVWDLLDEVIDIFDADEVTIGGDEFLDFGEGVPVLEAEAKRRFGAEAGENDVWIAFLNDTIDRLAARGIAAGVYNDGIRGRRVVDLDRRATVHYWTRWGAHMAPPADLAAAGYRLVNWDGEALYFVLKNDPDNRLPTAQSVWQRFDPAAFPDKVGATRLDPAGACFSIWCDHPDALAGDEVVALVREPLYTYGAVLWPVGRHRPLAALTDEAAAMISPVFRDNQERTR